LSALIIYSNAVRIDFTNQSNNFEIKFHC